MIRLRDWPAVLAAAATATGAIMVAGGGLLPSVAWLLTGLLLALIGGTALAILAALDD